MILKRIAGSISIIAMKICTRYLKNRLMINSGREWDWMQDLLEDGIDDFISVPTGSGVVED
tara:strand:- start:105 stop:287 length:183 start_codon:yes stop_codon:yes gene_type:complete